MYGIIRLVLDVLEPNALEGLGRVDGWTGEVGNGMGLEGKG